MDKFNFCYIFLQLVRLSCIGFFKIVGKFYFEKVIKVAINAPQTSKIESQCTEITIRV